MEVPECVANKCVLFNMRKVLWLMGIEVTASSVGHSEGRLSAPGYDVYFTLDRVEDGSFEL